MKYYVVLMDDGGNPPEEFWIIGWSTELWKAVGYLRMSKDLIEVDIHMVELEFSSYDEFASYVAEHYLDINFVTEPNTMIRQYEIVSRALKSDSNIIIYSSQEELDEIVLNFEELESYTTEFRDTILIAAFMIRFIREDYRKVFLEALRPFITFSALLDSPYRESLASMGKSNPLSQFFDPYGVWMYQNGLL